MSRLPWPELFQQIRPHLALKGSGEPDREGWVTSRCINAANHSNGDAHHSLRVNVKSGGVKCMSQDCAVGPNMNTLAARLGVETQDEPTPQLNGQIGTIADLASSRKLPVEVLKTWGVTADKRGWRLSIDDPDAGAYQRWKRSPWAADRPKYWWTPKGCPASDLIYGLSKVPADTKELMITAGEPDVWTLHHAGLTAISFLAGENAAPSDRAIEKLRAALPKLKSVQLSYDRDEAGIRGAGRVGSVLTKVGLAVDIITLPDDLPDGGDVTDLWLSCNGEAEGFLRRLYGCESKRLVSHQPHVEQKGDDHFTVSLPCEGGWSFFDFQRLSRGTRSLDSELSVSLDLPGATKEHYVTAINVMSTSAREGLRRQLEQSHDPALPWAAMINTAVSRLRTAYFETDFSIDLSTVEPRNEQERYRVGLLLPEGQPTVFFGDGSTGKTYLSLIVALCVAAGEELLGLPVIPSRVLIIDYETDAQTHRFRYDRLLPGFGLAWQKGLIDYWPAKGRPFVDIVDAVRLKVERDHIGLVVVDSAGYACGGDPSNPETALSYFNALNSLQRTSLTIAHVPKDSDQDKPYGSVFWSNGARKTWNFRRVQNEGEDVIHVGMFNKKVNDGRKDSPIGVRIAFDGETGPVSVKREEIRNVPELDEHRAIKYRIRDALKQIPDGGKTTSELADELSETENSVGTAARRDDRIVNVGEGRGGAAKWALRTSRR